MTSSFLLLVGSFSPMISTLNFTLSPPSLTLVSQTPAGTSPTWLLGNPTNSSIFYATDETETGGLNSLIIDHVTGKVTPIASISTQGGSPTHIGMIGNGSTQLGVANYGGGSVFFTTLEDDHLHFANPQLVKFDSVQKSNAHQVVSNGAQVLVSDLGADRVWRLNGGASGQWSIQGAISRPSGSGPRHIVVDDSSLYTLHERANTLTQQTAVTPSSTGQPTEVASISIIPSDTPASATLYAGELLLAHTPSPVMYASNREDPSPAGDAIAVFELNPLTKVAEIRTGLQHLRGVALVGEDNAYLIAGGMKGGGIKVYERISAAQGYLKEVASLPAGVVDQPSSFIWVPPQDVATGGTTQASTATASIPGVVPTSSVSRAHRRYKIGSW